MPRALVVVLTFNSAHDLDACFGSLARATREGADAPVLAIDSGSTDGTPELLRSCHPWVETLALGENVGYGAGNNRGLRIALERGFEFVFLLNPDTEVEADFLDAALTVADADPAAASVQSLLLLDSAPEAIDSAGNRLHLLGFGYCALHRRPRAEAPVAPLEIGFASGAAVLLRTRALAVVGLLREDLELYCEDLDLGWRLRLAGYRALLAPSSIVRHRHEFLRNRGKLRLLERNRFLVLLANFSARSLVVLGPLLAANEVAMLAIAVTQGWGREKLRAWRELLQTRRWRALASARRAAQAIRSRPDAEVVAIFTPRMEVDGRTGFVLDRIANPLLGLAWRLVRPLL